MTVMGQKPPGSADRKNLLRRRIGVTARALMRLRGMTARALADAGGYTEPQISRLLNGKQHWKDNDLEAVTNALELPHPGVLFETPHEALRMLGMPEDLIAALLGNSLTPEQMAITSRYRAKATERREHAAA